MILCFLGMYASGEATGLSRQRGGFESRHPRFFWSSSLTARQCVYTAPYGGSTPSSTTMNDDGLVEWLGICLQSRIMQVQILYPSPISLRLFQYACSSTAEPSAHNRQVGGSSPPRRTFLGPVTQRQSRWLLTSKSGFDSLRAHHISVFIKLNKPSMGHSVAVCTK